MSEKTEPPAEAPPPYSTDGQPVVQPAALPGQPQPAGTFVSQGPGQPPIPPGGTTVVFTTPGVVVPPDHPTRCNHPVRMVCPSCQQNIETTIERKIGLMTWMVVGMLFLIGFGFPLLWLGCCFIPMCIGSFKDVKHSCPNCEAHLGTYVIAK